MVRTSIARPLYVNIVLLAMTQRAFMRDNAVMMSWVNPSVKLLSWESPPLASKGENGDGRPVGYWEGLATSSGWRAARHRADRTRRTLDFANLSDEANPLARDGADQPLMLAAVADRVPGGGNSRLGKRRFRTMRPFHTCAIRSSLLTTRSAIADEIVQQVEHLRLKGDKIGSAP